MNRFLEKMRVWLRWIIIRAQSKPVFKQVLSWWCRWGAWRVSRLLLKTPGVVAVYSRHTHPGFPSFVPGHSDLDATIILSEDAAWNPERIEAVSSKVKALSWFHYYLSPSDIRITSPKELARVTRNYSSRYEPLYTPDDWILLAGQEVRSEKALDFPAVEIPWHPEFNVWWQHILQHYLLVPKPGLEDQYLRVFYRSALRQQLQFLAASGKEVTKPLGHVDDDLVEAAFREHPDLRALLIELKRNDFWYKNPQHLQERILLAVLQLAAEFFRTYTFHPTLAQAPACGKDGGKRHKTAYDALKSRLDQAPQLTKQLKGVLIYPIPHCSPTFYQVDLVIPDDLSAVLFSQTLRLAHETFRGREFHLHGQGFSITYVPESILNRPLLFLGSPYPFLKEHIQRYGEYLLGPEPPALEGAWNHEDLVQWCRVFLPYYMITLARRIEHSSRSINFCQLASIKLFLETGEKETDPETIRRRHRDLFKEESPEDQVWDYLLRDKPGLQNRKGYIAATSSLFRECRQVETLLARKKGVKDAEFKP